MASVNSAPVVAESISTREIEKENSKTNTTNTTTIIHLNY